MDPPKKDLLIGISQLVGPIHNMTTWVFSTTEFPKRSPERLGQIQGLEGFDQVGEIPWETSTKK